MKKLQSHLEIDRANHNEEELSDTIYRQIRRIYVTTEIFYKRMAKLGDEVCNVLLKHSKTYLLFKIIQQEIKRVRNDQSKTHHKFCSGISKKYIPKLCSSNFKGQSFKIGTKYHSVECKEQSDHIRCESCNLLQDRVRNYKK